jgi:hypothetical protein
MALIAGFAGNAAARGLNVSCETAGADGFIGTYATLAIAPGIPLTLISLRLPAN